VPTRELAMQVAEAFHKYARGSGLSVVPLYGGAPMHQQIRSLERGAHIVVATPGRALDHARRGTLKLDSIRILVLDEADEMLDMGFADDLDELLKATPRERQTALFSATMPSRILAIADRHLKDAARVTIAREKPAAGTIPRVRQVAYIVGRAPRYLVVRTAVAAAISVLLYFFFIRPLVSGWHSTGNPTPVLVSFAAHAGVPSLALAFRRGFPRRLSVPAPQEPERG